MSSLKVYRQPLLIGYLEKKKSNNAINLTVKWVKRWWCLRDDKLIYFRERNDVDPRETYWLKDISGVRRGKDTKFLEIVIEHSSRVLTLRASTEEDLSRWIGAITSAVQKVKELERIERFGQFDLPFRAGNQQSKLSSPIEKPIAV